MQLKGKGVLTATGTGCAAVRGLGGLTLRCYGTGTLIIRDADHARVKIRGRGRKVRRGNTIIIRGLRGRVSIKGRVNVRFTGGRVYLRAVGKGQAFLKGRGRYRVNHRRWQHWTRRGVRVKY